MMKKKKWLYLRGSKKNCKVSRNVRWCGIRTNFLWFSIYFYFSLNFFIFSSLFIWTFLYVFNLFMFSWIEKFWIGRKSNTISNWFHQMIMICFAGIVQSYFCVCGHWSLILSIHLVVWSSSCNYVGFHIICICFFYCFIQVFDWVSI